MTMMKKSKAGLESAASYMSGMIGQSDFVKDGLEQALKASQGTKYEDQVKNMRGRFTALKMSLNILAIETDELIEEMEVTG